MHIGLLLLASSWDWTDNHAMANQFDFKISNTSGAPLDVGVAVGDVLYIVGANGAGKSSLVAWLSSQRPDAVRVSAHRQLWFESSSQGLTPQGRQNLEGNFQHYKNQLDSRHVDREAIARINATIFDLIEIDTMQDRKIADLVRSGDQELANEEAQKPSLIQVINRLMRQSNLAVEITIEEGQKIVARKNGGGGYSVAELSDGERNAFLIAAIVLATKPGDLIIIDEPERHLHRSIASPLLTSLFERRKDCAFIVSTHELSLLMDTPRAAALLLRGCEYDIDIQAWTGGSCAQTWTADFLAPGAEIDDDLKRDILGSRRKIIFVEGQSQSLDAPLYSLLFPEVSIIPKGGCAEVERAVRGLRGAKDVHWNSI